MYQIELQLFGGEPAFVVRTHICFCQYASMCIWHWRDVKVRQLLEMRWYYYVYVQQRRMYPKDTGSEKVGYWFLESDLGKLHPTKSHANLVSL